MQEIIVFTIATIALVYLFIKFVIKRKSHDCGKCGIADNKETKNQ